MAKLEETGRARGSLARGLGRVLIVLAGLYWLTGAFVAFEVYQSEYQGVVGAAATAKSERDTAADIAASVADATAAADAASAAAAAGKAWNPAAGGAVGPWTKDQAPPSPKGGWGQDRVVEATPTKSQRAAEAYRRGLMGPHTTAPYEEAVRRGIVADPYALDHVAKSAGLSAAGGTLFGWTIGFAVLTAIALVIRWVWRGFAGKPKGAG